MYSKRKEFISLLINGNIDSKNLSRALKVSGVWPSQEEWGNYLSKLLLWLGSIAIALAVIFFVAFNWENVGRFAKFSLIQGLLIAVIAAYFFFKEKPLAQKVLLTVASLLTGALMALYHQTYQTGADPWQLFFTWGILIIPWAVAARFASLWFIQVFLLNLSLFLYLYTSDNLFGLVFATDASLLWLLFVFNAIILFVWELAARKFDYLTPRWPVRMIALASGVAISFLCLWAIFDSDEVSSFAFLVWVLTMAGVFFVYRKLRPDLFILTMACLSGIIIITSFVSYHLLRDSNEGGLLLIALLVIGLASGSAFWLRKVNKEFNNA